MAILNVPLTVNQLKALVSAAESATYQDDDREKAVEILRAALKVHLDEGEAS